MTNNMTYKKALLKTAGQNNLQKFINTETVGGDYVRNAMGTAQRNWLLNRYGKYPDLHLFRNSVFDFFNKRTPAQESRIHVLNNLARQLGYNPRSKTGPMAKMLEYGLYKGKRDTQIYGEKGYPAGDLEDPGIPKLLNPSLARPKIERILRHGQKTGRLKKGQWDWIQGMKKKHKGFDKIWLNTINQIGSTRSTGSNKFKHS